MKKIFLDTDFGPDCDDVGALCLLHALCGRGEAEFIGATHCTSSPYGLPAISAVNRYMGREVPLGTYKGPDFLRDAQVYTRSLAERYPNEYLGGRQQRDGREVFADVMREQPDGEVTFVAIGPLNMLYELLNDRECYDLIERKVGRMITMSGRFDDRPEWNIEMDLRSARDVYARWPGEIIMCPYECGEHVLTGACLDAWPEHPAGLAYWLHTGGTMLRPSWDLAAVYFAARGTDDLYALSSRGNVEISEGGVTTFTEDVRGRVRYMMMSQPPDAVAAAFEEMLEETCGAGGRIPQIGRYGSEYGIR